MIEDGDRISARFTYIETFSKAFAGYQPNSTSVQMRSIDISRVKDGKLIEHWDEFNLLEVFPQIGAAAFCFLTIRSSWAIRFWPSAYSSSSTSR